MNKTASEVLREIPKVIDGLEKIMDGGQWSHPLVHAICRDLRSQIHLAQAQLTETIAPKGFPYQCADCCRGICAGYGIPDSNDLVCPECWKKRSKTDPKPTKSSVCHYALPPGSAFCGADVPNQKTTTIMMNTTCAGCLGELLRREVSENTLAIAAARETAWREAAAYCNSGLPYENGNAPDSNVMLEWFTKALNTCSNFFLKNANVVTYLDLGKDASATSAKISVPSYPIVDPTNKCPTCLTAHHASFCFPRARNIPCECDRCDTICEGENKVVVCKSCWEAITLNSSTDITYAAQRREAREVLKRLRALLMLKTGRGNGQEHDRIITSDVKDVESVIADLPPVPSGPDVDISSEDARDQALDDIDGRCCDWLNTPYTSEEMLKVSNEKAAGLVEGIQLVRQWIIQVRKAVAKPTSPALPDPRLVNLFRAAIAWRTNLHVLPGQRPEASALIMAVDAAASLIPKDAT